MNSLKEFIEKELNKPTSDDLRYRRLLISLDSPWASIADKYRVMKKLQKDYGYDFDDHYDHKEPKHG